MRPDFDSVNREAHHHRSSAMQIHRKSRQPPRARKVERAVHNFLELLLDDSARQEIILAMPHAGAARRQKPKTRVRRRLVPRWDAKSRRLWFGATLIKEFSVPAANQEIVLTAFEERGWPPCIDDPLPTDGEVDPKRRLQNTLLRLNRSHKSPLIRFGGNGSGRGIRWMRRDRRRQSAVKSTAKRV
ncbi:MAG TPA: hypothetical protein VGH32_10060 [Pirellulales bacterium]